MTATSPSPGIRRIKIADLVDSLAAGIRDFRAAPLYGFLVGAIFMLAGWLLMALLVRFGMPYLAYPLAMGFVIVAPFAAVVFYAVSDLLERGEPVSSPAVRAAVGRATKHDLRWMAFVTGFALVIWMDIAAFIFFAFMGFQSFDARIVETLFTTPTGLIFLLFGHAAGAVIAAIVFSISAVSFPMLYHRDIDFVTAMATSVRTVMANPAPMLCWGGLIGVLMALSVVSGLLALPIVLPVIGHATWHLYRRAVDADAVIAASKAPFAEGGPVPREASKS